VLFAALKAEADNCKASPMPALEIAKLFLLLLHHFANGY